MLSVIVITKNEARDIARCLASVAWADEIIVLDSGSSDDTVAICQRFTQQVVVTDWPGFGRQKQRALDRARGDWVLSLDADEEVSPALKQEIQQAMLRTDVQGLELPRLSSYCGRQMRHGGWWPDPVLRLFRRDAGRFSDDVVHERVVVAGSIGRLREPLLHESYVDLDEVLSKVNRYSTLGAQQLFAQGRRSSLGLAIGKGIWTFLRTYVLRAGFLDGPQGLMLALSNAQTSYYKYLKLRDLYRTQATAKPAP